MKGGIHFGTDDALDTDELLVDSLEAAFPHLGGEVIPARYAHAVSVRVVFVSTVTGWCGAFNGEIKVVSRDIEPRNTPRVEVREVTFVAIFSVVGLFWEDGFRWRSKPGSGLRKNAEQLAFATPDVEDLELNI
jgi:hypothetical protein